jgi:predicted Rossmann fold nucleotide-binding protein DprA/Smf involved in DNA uptake
MPIPELGADGPRPPEPPQPEGKEELAILDSLASGARLVDDIASKTGLDVPTLLEKLLAMELRGLVSRTGGAHYESVTR